MKKVSRRDFLSGSSFALSSAFLLQTSLKANGAKFSNFSCGEANNTKILIVYESEFGSTKEVAEFIGRNYCHKGVSVDVQWAQNIKNIQGYSGVILGSAIHYDDWMGSMKKFVKAHEDMLMSMRVGYFFTCMTLSRGSEKSIQEAQSYANKLKSFSKITPHSIGQFAGVLDYGKMSFIHRMMAKPIFAMLGIKEGDYRDWEQIKGWSDTLYTSFEKG